MIKTLKLAKLAQRERFFIPRSVQRSIPIKRMYRDDIWMIAKLFTRTWRFTDINYAVAGYDDQKEMFLTYCAVLNSLPIDAMAKITIYNRRYNQQEFERVMLMERRGDALDKYRYELNGIIGRSIDGNNNLIQDKFITVSAAKRSIEEARTFFGRVDTDLSKNFSALSSKLSPMDNAERLRILHDIFNPGSEQFFHFDMDETVRRGHDFRDAVCPDSMEFKPRYFTCGDKFGRVLVLQTYASYLKDVLVKELTDFPRNLVLSIDILPVPMDESVKDAQSRILAIDSDITRWQQKQNAHNNFSARIPYELELLRNEATEFMDDLTTRDQHMMFATVTLAHFADSLEELDADTQTLISIGRTKSCEFGVLGFQQEEGLNTVLPYGLQKLDAMRTLTTECAAALMPFKVQEISDAGGAYCGVNPLSKKPIFCNRKRLQNPHGFILGVSGSGKSVGMKSAIANEKPTAWETVQRTAKPRNGSHTAKNRYNEAANPPETPNYHYGAESESQRVVWRKKARRDVIKERQTLDQPRESKPIKNASQIETHFDMRERRAAASSHAPKPAAITPQAKTPQQEKPAPFPKTKAAFSPTIHPSIKPAERQAKQQTVKELTQKAGQKAAKQAERAGERIVKAVGRTVERGMSALVGAGAGGVLLVLLLFLGAVAAIAASPFGLYFAAERNAQDAVTVAEAVAQVNADLNNRLETLQNGDYDEITVEGAPPDWTDVLAVFAVKTAGTDDGVDVATLDADRVDRLKAVFWDMTAISSEVETIDHPGEGEDEGWTEYILHITITAKSEADMRQDYALTSQQINALDELLSDRAALSALAEDLTVTRADARELLDALPDDLDLERRAVVEAACSLVGKVNYHWGGKSLVLGWDSRWGQIQKVTADGNDTTGTYRPYGLDCSGFVDWVFYNATDGAYYPSHGGGATMQHSYCTPISWENALPGDLVFYPGDEHVGIVGGWARTAIC